MSAPTQEESVTYMGIPVDHIVIMYDYLKNYDGAIDGGFSEGFWRVQGTQRKRFKRAWKRRQSAQSCMALDKKLCI